MVAVHPGKIKVQDALVAANIHVSNGFTVSWEVLIDACELVIVWVPIQELDDIPPMRVEGQVIVSCDSVRSSPKPLHQSFADVLRACARRA